MSKKILKASAGTGKTYRLALEYVVSLIRGEKFSDIIVMTFTNKAISEIEERIIKFLYELSKETEEGIKLKEQINKIYPELQLKKEEIRKIYYDILVNRDKLAIYTLDAFKILIFKNAIAPMKEIFAYEIIDEGQNNEILKRVFERITESKEKFNKFEEFFSENLERDAEKYIELLGKIIKYRWRYIFIKNKSGLSKREKLDIKDDDIIGIYDSIKEKIIELQEFRAEGKPLTEYANKSFEKYLSLKTEKEKLEFILENFKELLETNNLHNGRKTTGKKEKIVEFKEEFIELKEEANKLLAKKIFNEKMIPYEEQVLSFLETVYEIYDEIKLSERKFTQDDIRDYLLIYMGDEKLNLIEDGKISNYMKEIVDSQCTSIFIDEFQDTSIAQWKMLEPFVNSATNIICVGDEKQSIYGWRDGEKNLFRDLAKIIDGEEEYLDISFRSEKNIVDFTNEVFEDISHTKDFDFKPSKSSKEKTEGGVRIYNFSENEDPETAYINELMRILKEDFNGKYNGIGVIARKNKYLDSIAEEFTKNKIGFIQETNQSIFNHKSIIPVIKLLRYFISENIFYLLEFLRDDLILIGDRFMRKFLDISKESENLDEFYEKVLNLEEFIEERKVIEKIEKIYKKYSENNFENMDIILDIIKEFGIVEIYNKETEIKNIYNFIRVGKNFNNVREFIEEIIDNGDKSNYRQESSKEEESISLITIHKSKGLEFDTVFFIANEDKNRADTGMNISIKLDEKYSEVKSYLIYSEEYKNIIPYIDEIYDFQGEKERKKMEEELNNLYVALTRPKGNLIIFIKNMKKSDSFYGDVFKRYLDDLLYEKGELKIYDYPEKEKEKEIEKDFEVDFSSLEISKEKKEENIDKIKEDTYKYSLELEEKRNVGNIVHYFLENISYGDEEEIEKSKKKTFSKYGALLGQEKIEKEILTDEKIKNIFENNKEIFSRKWDIIYNEYSIYSEKDSKLYRIDRLMIDNENKEIFIVDYKTGTYEEEQIETYKNLVYNSLMKIGAEKNYSIKTKYVEIY